MKKYRRIEITAFRRRITIVSGEQPTATAQSDEDVYINDADSQKAIELESAEGHRILTEALRLLEEKLSNQTRRDYR